MMTWEITNGVIYIKDHDKCYAPKAKEIFEANERGCFNFENNCVEAPKDCFDVRFSKIGIISKLKIVFDDGKILLRLFAIKKGLEYPIMQCDNSFLDYVVIDNVWHFLSGDYITVFETISKLNIVLHEGLSYIQYMELTRELSSKGIVYEDLVSVLLDNIKESETPFDVANLNATLFKYQEKGARWLSFMYDNKCGCILGDEMGLGKTIQIIALFAKIKERNPSAKYLVVAPVSLLENWRREIEKFYPQLKTLVHHGSGRTGSYHTLLNYDVIIMSYSNVHTDRSMLEMILWDVLVIDEAQNIKNPYASRTKNVKSLKKQMAIAVTGTPFENHMTDIWSLVDFVIPGYLGTLNEYETIYKDDLDSAVRVEKMVTPIMLRRLVKDVAQDLPSRVDIPQPILMTADEAKLYEDQRKKTMATMEDLSLSSMRLDNIQALRMFCSHPLVYDPTIQIKDPIQTSNKYQRLCDIVEEIVASHEKAIVFTSFNKMIGILYEDLCRRYGVKTWYINGSIAPSERQKIIDSFSANEDSAVLILNPKAAGAGLNITAANHVIHYNLEWNPAVEDQASARSYRRGQTKTVFVHRLFYSGTIEEIINERISRKRTMSSLAIVGNLGDVDDRTDLIKALGMSPI